MSTIHLRHSDPTLFGQFFLGFLTWIGIRQMGVEILIQHFCGLLVEVAPLASNRDKRKNLTTHLELIYILKEFMFKEEY